VLQPEQQQLLQQGLDLMIYGMSMVFLFLIILVSVIALVSAVIVRFFPEPVSLDAEEQPVSPAGRLNRKLLLVLQDAIDQHRSNK
jgi:oxaloacetate decarboxylase gamma subunit